MISYRLGLGISMAKRGPYLQYEKYASELSVPRQTLHNRRLALRNNDANAGKNQYLLIACDY